MALDWSFEVGTAGALLFGLASVARGAMVKVGRWRGYQRWYEDPELPLVLRNGFFGLLPLGIGLLLFGAMGLAGAGTPVRGLSVFALLFAVDSLILVVVRPPAFLKPRWVLEREMAGQSPGMKLRGLDKLIVTILGIANALFGIVVVSLLSR